VDSTLVEGIHAMAMLPQMKSLQPESLSVRKDWQQEITHRGNESFQLDIERILPKIIVQVANQMHKAFLLQTRKRVITAVKIRNEHAPVVGQETIEKARFTTFSQPEDNMLAVSQNPHVMVAAKDAEFCFINMNGRTFENPIM